MYGKKLFFKNIISFKGVLIGCFCILFIACKNNTNTYTSFNKDNSSCISCHTVMSGFSSAHLPEKISCTACHLGNPNSSIKTEAHLNMVSVPGNLSNASQTCAKCHKGIDVRIQNSIMNTMSGIISVDKHLFNENTNLDSLFNIHHLKNDSFADSHLRNKCASCHLGNEKESPAPISQKSRGGGCTACHLNYSNEAKKAHQKYIVSDKIELTNIHPSLSLNISDNHCFGCHSRSGRIATNYEGWHETLFKDTLADNSNYRILDDTRVFEKKAADIHKIKGLSCIDCHDTNDVMGDGIVYAHQEDATNISCKDCHFSTPQKTIVFSDLNEDQKRIIHLKEIDTTHLFVHSSQTDKNLINVIYKNDTYYLLTKNSSQKIKLLKPSSQCTKEVHKNISCSTCHTQWTPQCISCHTFFEKDEDGYDLLAKKWKMGTWNEKGDHFLAEFPTLGVISKKGNKEIRTFTPGMILTLKKDKDTTFHRFFAPTSSHTIAAKGQQCKTCHNNPVTLGYGRGKLTFSNQGIWHFTPAYPNGKDQLPLDAWISFLTTDTLVKATRKNARPFSKKEQQKILRVGACFTCHQENTIISNALLTDFKKAIHDMSNECVMPRF